MCRQSVLTRESLVTFATRKLLLVPVDQLVPFVSDLKRELGSTNSTLERLFASMSSKVLDQVPS